MSDFAGIETAEVSQKLPPIRAGNYLFEVQALRMINSRTKGKLFVAEYKVLEASGPNANEVGSTCSHIIKMSLDNALGNVKALASALTQEPTNAITVKMCDAMVGEKQPGRGKTVRAQAGVIKTRAGNDFTLVNYSEHKKTVGGK